MSHLQSREKLWRLAQDLTWVNLAMLAGNLASFGYQIGLSRDLTAADYGLWSALLAMTMLLQIPVSTINMLVVRRVAEANAQGAREQIWHFLRGALMTVSRYILIGLAVFAAVTPVLLKALDVASPVPLVVVAATAATAIWVPLGLATLQGLQKFGALALATLIQRASILLGLGLVALGAGISGAICGLLIGNVLGIVLSFSMSQLELSRQREQNSPETPAALQVDEAQGWSVAATYALMTTFLYVDLLLARYFLAPEAAGQYAAVAVLGKAIYYAPIGIVMLLIPKVASARMHASSTTHFLYLALTGTAVLVAPIVVAFSLFPGTIISAVFGDKYKGESTTELMQLYVVASVLLTLVAVSAQYYLAKHSTRFVWALVAGLIVTLVAVLISHQSSTDIAIALIAGNGTTLMGGFILECRPTPAAAGFREKPADTYGPRG